jgi:F0F1-type ATP synthase assembly protein I
MDDGKSQHKSIRSLSRKKRNKQMLNENWKKENEKRIKQLDKERRTSDLIHGIILITGAIFGFLEDDFLVVPIDLKEMGTAYVTTIS